MVMRNALFDASSALGARQPVPANHVLRPLELTDYRKGYMDCLANLTVVGDVSEQDFAESFEEMQRAQSYFIIVVEDLEVERIVATGTLLVEQKMIRGCGRVGHIEDIVVAKGQQGKRFGLTIVKQLLEIAQTTNCYKTILDCDAENVKFYEKCGLVNKGVQMAVYTPASAKQ
ncbi:Glucosamine-phosphate N-acetyltransferase-like protein [Coemansia sp. RSA 552]|nr:Glucosamine-phosphate N-acetyltransferase-like protein [Coemansia sp. RSA 552]